MTKLTKSIVEINLLVGSSLALPFEEGGFEFVFDIGRFHHVEARNRAPFIRGARAFNKAYFTATWYFRGES